MRERGGEGGSTRARRRPPEPGRYGRSYSSTLFVSNTGTLANQENSVISHVIVHVIVEEWISLTVCLAILGSEQFGEFWLR